MLLAVHHLGGAVLDHEELVTKASLADEALPGLDVDLVSLTSDLGQLVLRQTLEQRESL